MSASGCGICAVPERIVLGVNRRWRRPTRLVCFLWFERRRSGFARLATRQSSGSAHAGHRATRRSCRNHRMTLCGAGLPSRARPRDDRRWPPLRGVSRRTSERSAWPPVRRGDRCPTHPHHLRTDQGLRRTSIRQLDSRACGCPTWLLNSQNQHQSRACEPTSSTASSHRSPASPYVPGALATTATTHRPPSTRPP